MDKHEIGPNNGDHKDLKTEMEKYKTVLIECVYTYIHIISHSMLQEFLFQLNI